MAITSLVATRFAPVTVTGITPLTGYNTVWISGGAGEVINVALSGGGRFGSPGGNASQILTLDGNGDGLVRVCFPALANGPATAVLTAKDTSGGQWRRVLSFAPLMAGPGKFLWYGAAVGASAGGSQNAAIFVALDQKSDLGPMRLVAARATGAGLIRSGGATADRKILSVGADGCGEIQVVDPLPDTVTVRASMPESADGEVLFVNCPFVADVGLAETGPAGVALLRRPVATGGGWMS